MLETHLMKSSGFSAFWAQSPDGRPSNLEHASNQARRNRAHERRLPNAIEGSAPRPSERQRDASSVEVNGERQEFPLPMPIARMFKRERFFYTAKLL
jgi:hypothetical protein